VIPQLSQIPKEVAVKIPRSAFCYGPVIFAHLNGWHKMNQTDFFSYSFYIAFKLKVTQLLSTADLSRPLFYYIIVYKLIARIASPQNQFFYFGGLLSFKAFSAIRRYDFLFIILLEF